MLFLYFLFIHFTASHFAQSHRGVSKAVNSLWLCCRVSSFDLTSASAVSSATLMAAMTTGITMHFSPLDKLNEHTRDSGSPQRSHCGRSCILVAAVSVTVCVPCVTYATEPKPFPCCAASDKSDIRSGPQRLYVVVMPQKQSLQWPPSLPLH